MIIPLNSRAQGQIEVICGSMFSGKSQELIRRLKLAKIAKQKIQAFNSSLDNRYGENCIVSHDQTKIPCIAVKKSEDILKYLEADTQVVGIDEVNFFDDGIVEVCQQLADQGKRVIAAGLDQNYKAEPFKNTADLMAIAEFVSKNYAVCMICGAPANRSKRLVKSDSLIEVGAADKYEARCRKCYHLD